MNGGDTMELPQVHLSPGQLLVTREPKVVATVLGSCVAVTMFDRRTAFAAICHAMLATPQPRENVSPTDPLRFRYVAVVLPAMISACQRAGVRMEMVEVKLFGGANVIGESHNEDPHWIGGGNLATARRLLENAGLAISAENTGGRRGRKILFNTGTGEVLHKYLRNPRS